MAQETLLEDHGSDIYLAAAEEVFNDEVLYLRVLRKEQTEQLGNGEALKLTEYKAVLNQLGKAAIQAQTERNRLAELRRKEAGFVGGTALDLGAARREISKQLDRIAEAERAAGIPG